MQEISVVRILPLPRHLPKAVVWSMYSVFLIGLIATIAAILNGSEDPLKTNDTTKTSEELMPRLFWINVDDNISNEEIETSKARPKQQSKIKNRSGLLELEEVVAYECHYETRFKSISWLAGSDEEISYENELGVHMIMNVTDGRTYTTREDRSYNTRQLMQSTISRNPEDGESTIRQHVAMTWNCYRDESQERKCYFKAKLFSSQELRVQQKRVVKIPRGLIDCPYLNDHLTHAKNYLNAGSKNRRLYDWRRLNDYQSKYAFEFVKIGRTNWILHTIIQKDNFHNRSILNIGISREKSLKQNHMEQNNTYRWIPKAGNTYKPLLRKNLFVTKILAAKVISDDEALAYFVAAPTRNFSYRFLYRTKVVYPPLGYSTLEAVDCLTCPEIERGRSVSSNGGDYERPSSSIERGFRSICLWSEVLMSRTARNYILKCRGPNFPWSAVFSTDTNLSIRYLSYQENFSSWYSSRMHTSTYDFEVELDDGFLAQARLHLPPDWKNEADQCNSRIKLILRLANQPNGQMVTTKYDTSLATYLPIAGPYAVLYADVRSSKFHNLDFAGLRFRRRETMQMEDYTRVANHIADKFQCIDAELGFGVLGEAYGGHMALNLAADNSDNGKAAGHFQCSVALKPFADWQLYLDTFTGKPFGRVVSRTRRKKLHSALARRLRGKDFILYTSESRRRYTDALLELLAQNRVVYEHRRYEEHCDSRLYFYRQIREYFDRCFQRHSLGIDKF